MKKQCVLSVFPILLMMLSLTSITFAMQPTKYDWIDGPCLVPLRRDGFCAEPGAPIRRVDHGFLRKRDDHKAATEEHIRITNELNGEYGEVAELTNRLAPIFNVLVN